MRSTSHIAMGFLPMAARSQIAKRERGTFAAFPVFRINFSAEGGKIAIIFPSSRARTGGQGDFRRFCMVNYEELIKRLSRSAEPFGLLTMQATSTTARLKKAFNARLRAL